MFQEMLCLNLWALPKLAWLLEVVLRSCGVGKDFFQKLLIFYLIVQLIHK